MSSKRERISLRSFGIFALAIISLGFFTASPSYALDFYWVDGSGTWNDANNWSLTQGGPGGAGVPGYLDGIFVTQSDAVNRFVDFTGFNNLINGLSIGATGTGTMTFSIASGNIAGNAGFHGGTPFNISNSTINQSGGFISVSENTGLNIGNTIYNMSGGQVHSDAGVGIAFINISNSTINQTPNAGGFSVYDSGMNITKSVLNLSGGGFTTSGDISGLTISDSIINQTGGSIRAFSNGVSITNSTYNLSGGVLGVLSNYTYGVGIVGGTFNQTGGTVLGGSGFGGVNISGIYNLIGAGVINAGFGFGVSGTFNQTGGQVTGGWDGTTISGTYNLEGGSLTLIGHNGRNNGNFNYTGGSFSVQALAGPGMRSDPFTNNGTTTLSGSGIRVVDGGGDVLNNGTWKVTNTTAVYTGTFTNNGAYISDPGKNYFQTLFIGANGYLKGGLGDEFHFSGDFLNHSQNPLWNTDMADLFFGPGSHTFFLGDTVRTFNWDDMTLAYGTVLDLEGDATLHVKDLHLYDLGQLTGLGHISYDVLDITSVPEPSTMLLLGSGFIGLVGYGRKKLFNK